MQAFYGIEIYVSLRIFSELKHFLSQIDAFAHTCGPVGKSLGFSLDDKHLKRAGLDYWDSVKLFVHKDLDSFIDELTCSKRMFFFSKTATNSFFDVVFEDGDILVFGPEDKGFSEELLSKYKNRLVKIPMQTKNVRSLNLSSAVAVAVYEAIRQISNKRTL